MTIGWIKPKYDLDSNIFILIGDHSALIDTGTGICIEETIDDIKRILNGKKLDMVILTHCHADHIGGLASIIKEFGCKAYAGADADFIRTGSHVTLAEEILNIKLTQVDVDEIQDGEIIDLGEHRLRVIDTPGHTSGGICLYDEVSASLFSGDTVFSQGVGRTDFPTGSSKDLVTSLDKLSKVNIKSLHPGHGSVSSDGNYSVRCGLKMMRGSY